MKTNFKRNPSVLFLLCLGAVLPLVGFAQEVRENEPPDPAAADAPGGRRGGFRSSERPNTNDPIARIRDEGMNRSEVMQTLSYLTEVIGPRLTGSPNMKRANEWTRDKLASWGLTNAHLEAWGPFG